MSKVRIVWKEGLWEARDGYSVVTFASAYDAWEYKRGRERTFWQRLRRAA